MTNKRLLSNEHGFIKFILIIGIFVVCVYSGIKFGIPFYKYSALKADVKAFARISLGNTEKTREQIFERAQELKVPINIEHIKVAKTETGVRVQTAWSETVDLFSLYQKRLRFRIDIEE